MTGRLFLIDGSAYAYRSFHAIQRLTNAAGEPTNAVYGFARVLLKILREHQPDHIAVVFDAPGKTFREDIYREYKATRPPTPEDLVAQMPYIDELVRALNIALIRVEGVEADDVLGTLARRAATDGMEVVLVSGDKDLMQLVSDRVLLFDPAKGDKGVWYRPEDVRNRFGVPPERVPDALGLMGDSADNVPGVRGIGEKTAKSLLETYGSIEGIYEHLDELKGKIKERLAEDRESAFLSRRLVTIDTAVPLDISWQDLKTKPFDRQRMADLFHRLSFHSLLNEIPFDSHDESEKQYRIVDSEVSLNTLIEQLNVAGAFALDTETTSTDPMRARLVGISVCCHPGEAYYIPVGHTVPIEQTGLFQNEQEALPLAPGQLAKAVVLKKLEPLLGAESVRKTGHNIKYDWLVLAREGIRLRGVWFDTMIASYLTDPSLLRHNLNEISLHYLKRKMTPIEDLIGRASKAITFDRVPIERASAYACEDADVTWQLTQHFKRELEAKQLDRLFYELEMPLLEVLARMEQRGIAIDSAVFEELQREVVNQLEKLSHEITEAAGESFQINSPKQLQNILFTKLGLKPTRKTKTGFSTDMEVLEELATQHPLPKKILEYRTIEKLRSTYIDALPKMIHPETGRIHTSFNQAVAATGRLSSSDPNLQNIPVRTELGRRIRRGFVAGFPGWKLISADYSQIELRILAHLSGDRALREAFERDADIHQDTAARLFGVLPEFVTPDMRRQAKAVNFGVIYGMTSFGLSRNLGISRSEAARFIENYFAQYPGVRRWIDATLADARSKGYVTTLFQRRRYIRDLTASDQNVRSAAERMAINTPVQGSAADIIKRAMIDVDRALESRSAKLLLQVHDELVVEAPAEEAEETAHMVKQIMEEAAVLDVPMKVDVGIGDNWAAIH